jgi:hypothetical protein
MERHGTVAGTPESPVYNYILKWHTITEMALASNGRCFVNRFQDFV